MPYFDNDKPIEPFEPPSIENELEKDNRRYFLGIIIAMHEQNIKLTKTECKILKARMKNRSFREIARKLKWSKSKVSELYNKAVSKLSKIMQR